jgi:hypothetical protein
VHPLPSLRFVDVSLASLAIGLAVALAFAVGYLVLDPIHELNHRWTGWLGE